MSGEVLEMQIQHITQNRGAIRTTVTWSKWNMGEIVGLKFHLSFLHTPLRFLFEIPPCGKKVIFVTEFVILCKNHSFSEVNHCVRKLLPAWRDFKNIFSRPLFTIICRPKMAKFYPYSILTNSYSYHSENYHSKCVQLVDIGHETCHWIKFALNWINGINDKLFDIWLIRTVCPFFSLGGGMSRILLMAWSGGSLKKGGSPSTISITMIPDDN